MENTYISREMAGRIYYNQLLAKGITDQRLLEGMTEDFLKTQYDTMGSKGFRTVPSSGSSAYNFNKTKARPKAPPISGMGMPTPSPAPYDPFGGGSANTGIPFFNPLGGGSANTGLPPPGVSATSTPIPRVRPELAGGAGTDTLRGGGGVDPLPQTSGHVDAVSRTGQESMNPVAAELLKKLMAQGMI